MVPVYALCSWLALVFKDDAIYLSTFREMYEAYVLYSFTFLLIRTLGTEHEAILKVHTTHSHSRIYTHVFHFTQFHFNTY